MRCCTQPKRPMPTPSNPATPTDAATAPSKMPRLRRAGNTIKILASIFVVFFLCAYAHTYLRYGTPRPQTTASIAPPINISRTQPPQTFHPRAFHRRQAILRPVHQVKRRTHRTNPYYLASLRRIRRLFSQLLFVRS